MCQYAQTIEQIFEILILKFSAIFFKFYILPTAADVTSLLIIVCISQYSTVVLTVVRVMIAMYRKYGNWGYRSSLTPEPIELKLCMINYVPIGPHMHNGVTRGLGG